MSLTAGQKLRQAREARSLTLEQVSQATRIRVHYLQALEAGNFDALPSATQGRGFLRAYASYLNLNIDDLLDSPLDNSESDVKEDKPATSPVSTDELENQAIRSDQTGQIFVEIGRQLRSQRELLGLSLEDVERHTHLRRHYLQALEAGDLSSLPSPVQGRGMLNNYAAFLGMDPEPLLLRFAEGLQAGLAVRKAGEPERKTKPRAELSTKPSRVRRFLSGELLLGGMIVLFLVVFFIWGAVRVFSIRSGETPTATAPSIADILLAPPTATTTFTPLPPSPTVVPTQLLFPTLAAPTDAVTGKPAPGVNQGAVQVYIMVHQRAWMSVAVDGKVEFEGRVMPGSFYNFGGDSQVEVLTGNGAALQIFLNQEDLGLMGSSGQVVNLIYTQDGELLPTPTVSPTPTSTPLVSATPSPLPTAPPGQATVPPLP